MILYFFKKILIRSKKSKLIHFKSKKYETSTNFSKNVTYLLLLYLNLIYLKIINKFIAVNKIYTTYALFN
jgi:hypothetical protein